MSGYDHQFISEYRGASCEGDYDDTLYCPVCDNDITDTIADLEMSQYDSLHTACPECCARLQIKMWHAYDVSIEAVQA